MAGYHGAAAGGLPRKEAAVSYDDGTRLTVSFDLYVGDVWVDAQEVAWFITGFADGKVQLERKSVHEVEPHDLLRQGRIVRSA